MWHHSLVLLNWIIVTYRMLQVLYMDLISRILSLIYHSGATWPRYALGPLWLPNNERAIDIDRFRQEFFSSSPFPDRLWRLVTEYREVLTRGWLEGDHWPTEMQDAFRFSHHLYVITAWCLCPGVPFTVPHGTHRALFWSWICVYVCVCVCVCMYVCTYVCMYVRTYVCTRVYPNVSGLSQLRNIWLQQ